MIRVEPIKGGFHPEHLFRRMGESMDINLVSLEGALAVPPEFRTFESGSRMARLLITTVVDGRTDVIPVVMWDPPETLDGLRRGDRVWTMGRLNRRFWTDGSGRNSRVDFVAEVVTVIEVAVST